MILQNIFRKQRFTFFELLLEFRGLENTFIFFTPLFFAQRAGCEMLFAVEPLAHSINFQARRAAICIWKGEDDDGNNVTSTRNEFFSNFWHLFLLF